MSAHVGGTRGDGLHVCFIKRLPARETPHSFCFAAACVFAAASVLHLQVSQLLVSGQAGALLASLPGAAPRRRKSLLPK